MNVYDAKGNLVKQTYNGRKEAGLQTFTIYGTSWANGTYFLQVIVNGQQMTRKLVLQKERVQYMYITQ